MGQRAGVQQFYQTFKIVGLIPVKIKSLHHMVDHFVIVSFHFIAVVFLRTEVTCDAKLFWVGYDHGRRIFFHSLRNGDVDLQTLLFGAAKVDKSAHGVEQTPRNGKPKPKPSRKSAASGVCLVKIIAHLGQLRIGHADAGIIDVNHQINPIAFRPEVDIHVNAAFFRKFNGVFYQDLQNMRDFFYISDKNCRDLWVQIKYHFQLLLAALHSGHGDQVVKYGNDPIWFFSRDQSSFHDFRIIKHIDDLIGKTLARQFYGLHVCPDIRGNIFFQYDFADSQHHVNGSPDFMGHIGQKFRVLPLGLFQLRKGVVVDGP